MEKTRDTPATTMDLITPSRTVNTAPGKSLRHPGSFESQQLEALSPVARGVHAVKPAGLPSQWV